MSVGTFYEALGLPGIAAPRPCFACSNRARGQADLVLLIERTTGAWQCFRCGAGGGPREAAAALGVPPPDVEAAITEHGLDGQAEDGGAPSPSGEAAKAHRSEALAPSVVAEELAGEPDILARLADATASAGLVGEEPRLKLLYLIATTRLLERPVSAVVKGPSSGGKSYLVEQTLRFLPDEAAYVLTAMSPRALAYSKEPLVHRMLVIYEAPGMDSEMASYLMRSLLSEGELRYETVVSTSQGLEAVQIHREGPTGLITTTTAIALHEENETRLISIPVSDSAEQTKAIMRAVAAGRPEAPDLTPWLALQARLRELAARGVVVPFAETLAEAIPPVAVRLRRDFPTLLTLIRAHALLHAQSRERDDQGAVVASLEDYGAVRELVADLMAEGLERSVPAAVRETVAAAGLLRAAGPGAVSVRRLAEALGLERSAASRRVRAALDRGLLRDANEHPGPGRELKLVLGDPLPAEGEVLPSLAELRHLCTCAASPEGEAPPDQRLERWEDLAEA